MARSGTSRYTKNQETRPHALSQLRLVGCGSQTRAGAKRPPTT